MPTNDDKLIADPAAMQPTLQRLPLITDADTVRETTQELAIITDRTIPCPHCGEELDEPFGDLRKCPKCHRVWTAKALIDARKGPAQ
jgi:Zn finger protein HypA/HybF involved in hydrogenase expression